MWVSVDDRLPEDGQWVLAHIPMPHVQADDFYVVQFCRGVTSVEAEERGWWDPSDQHGNNRKPYCWDGHGPLRFFGQEPTHWMQLPEPPCSTD